MQAASLGIEALSKITSLENELSSERKSRMLQGHQQQLIEQQVLEEQEGEILALRQQVETLEGDKRVKAWVGTQTI